MCAFVQLKELVEQKLLQSTTMQCRNELGENRSTSYHLTVMCAVLQTVLTLNIFENSIKKLKLHAFRMYQMPFYIVFEILIQKSKLIGHYCNRFW